MWPPVVVHPPLVENDPSLWQAQEQLLRVMFTSRALGEIWVVGLWAGWVMDRLVVCGLVEAGVKTQRGGGP